MCLYPKLIRNPKYIANKKNGGIVPEAPDPRVLMVPIGCQQCMECRKQKARNWSVRLQEEIRENKNGKFVTLTFSNESIAKLAEEIQELEGYDLDNEIATLATRRFLERWRKKHKKSVRHWLVTELGGNGTENIHLHGIIWTDEIEDIKNIWGYGYVFIGDYVNEKTINYIAKYINKIDFKHSEYNSKILTSAGIGGGYTRRPDSKLNKFKKKEETDESYKTRQGVKLSLPIYYRNKIYTEQEREQLWIQKLDKQERWVGGTRVDVSTKKGEDNYYRLLKTYQQKSTRLGYGKGEKNWELKKYQNEQRILKIGERIRKGKEKEEKNRK